MSLTDIQRDLADLLYPNTDRKVFLAGGGGMVLQGLIDRPTEDLDGFIHSLDDFVTIVAESEAVLKNNGYVLHADPRSRGGDPTQIRTWLVSKITNPEETTKIQFVRDYILLPPVKSDHGLTVDPVELAANKLIVIYDNGRARDYADLAYALHTMDFNDIIAVADEKLATPLDREMLAWGFRRIIKISDQDILERYPAADVPAIRTWALAVADVLDQGIDPSTVPLPPLPNNSAQSSNNQPSAIGVLTERTELDPGAAARHLRELGVIFTHHAPSVYDSPIYQPSPSNHDVIGISF